MSLKTNFFRFNAQNITLTIKVVTLVVFFIIAIVAISVQLKLKDIENDTVKYEQLIQNTQLWIGTTGYIPLFVLLMLTITFVYMFLNAQRYIPLYLEEFRKWSIFKQARVVEAVSTWNQAIKQPGVTNIVSTLNDIIKEAKRK